SIPASMAATSSGESGCAMSSPDTSPTNAGWIWRMDRLIGASLSQNRSSHVALEAQPPVLVPHLDEARLALVAKDAERRRVQRQAPPVDRRQTDPAGRENSQDVRV